MMKRKIVSFVAFCVLACSLAGSASAAEQYKKVGREIMSDIAKGKTEQAIESLNQYLEANPNDLESLYLLTLAYVTEGNLEQATQHMQEAVDAGLPFGRFVAGPREVFAPLYETSEYQELKKQYNPRLIHGPMLGCVNSHSARVWVRTADEANVRVVVCEAENAATRIESDTVRTAKENDYTAIVPVNGLKPNTEYTYSVSVDSKSLPERWTFCTHPPAGQKARFQVAFGGGAGYTPEYERMWNTVSSRDPLAFLFLGDNVYIDHPDQPNVQRYCYYRRQSRPEYRYFTGTRGIYAIWDDHDFVTNDSWGGPEIDEPAWKIPVWRLYKENWNNPSYAGGEDQPGCWFSFSIADVDFFMLDGRYYRTDPKVNHPSMLGPAQKEWLFKELKASTGTFKVLASPVPWSYGSKPGSLDPWQGYKEEREEIFSFLEENKIEGVILIAADRHRSDLWRIERPNGYDFYEFESSRLSNIHFHKVMPGSLFGYNEKCSFARLTFDTTQSDPLVTYDIINIDNELIHTFELRRSKLTF